MLNAWVAWALYRKAPTLADDCGCHTLSLSPFLAEKGYRCKSNAFYRSRIGGPDRDMCICIAWRCVQDRNVVLQ